MLPFFKFFLFAQTRRGKVYIKFDLFRKLYDAFKRESTSFPSNSFLRERSTRMFRWRQFVKSSSNRGDGSEREKKKERMRKCVCACLCAQEWNARQSRLLEGKKEEENVIHCENANLFFLYSSYKMKKKRKRSDKLFLCYYVSFFFFLY